MIVLAAMDLSSSSSAMSRLRSRAMAEPSHMCELNSGFCPFLIRSAPISSSGRMYLSRLFSGQWSVCRAMFTGYWSAIAWANSASATAPATMFLEYCPEPNSAPPVENWMMPSHSASAKPRMTATMVCDEVQLTAG